MVVVVRSRAPERLLVMVARRCGTRQEREEEGSREKMRDPRESEARGKKNLREEGGLVGFKGRGCKQQPGRHWK